MTSIFRQPSDQFADPLPEYLRDLILFRDGHCCVDCANRVPAIELDLAVLDARKLEVHHVNARQDGGDNHPSNLVTVCRAHHHLRTRQQTALRLAVAAARYAFLQTPTPGNLFALEVARQRARQAATLALGH